MHNPVGFNPAALSPSHTVTDFKSSRVLSLAVVMSMTKLPLQLLPRSGPTAQCPELVKYLPKLDAATTRSATAVRANEDTWPTTATRPGSRLSAMMFLHSSGADHRGALQRLDRFDAGRSQEAHWHLVNHPACHILLALTSCFEATGIASKLAVICKIQRIRRLICATCRPPLGCSLGSWNLGPTSAPHHLTLTDGVTPVRAE